MSCLFNQILFKSYLNTFLDGQFLLLLEKNRIKYCYSCLSKFFGYPPTSDCDTEISWWLLFSFTSPFFTNRTWNILMSLWTNCSQQCLARPLSCPAWKLSILDIMISPLWRQTTFLSWGIHLFCKKSAWYRLCP